jgi:predicted nucleotidyltransferase/uncharacterized protein with HEPN domain
MSPVAIEIDKDKLRAFCSKWKITEFSFFGSVLREDFRPDSDIDVLVTYADDAGWSLWDTVKASDELSSIFERKVDLVSRRAVEDGENPFRRETILSTAVSIDDIDGVTLRSAEPVPRAQHALYDVLLAARSIVEYSRNLTLQDWAHRNVTRHASLFQLGVVGRAALHVDESTREAFPEVPWATLETLEALTYYRYVDAHSTEIWRVISDDLPPTVRALERRFDKHVDDHLSRQTFRLKRRQRAVPP